MAPVASDIRWIMTSPRYRKPRHTDTLKHLEKIELHGAMLRKRSPLRLLRLKMPGWNISWRSVIALQIFCGWWLIMKMWDVANTGGKIVQCGILTFIPSFSSGTSIYPEAISLPWRVLYPCRNIKGMSGTERCWKYPSQSSHERRARMCTVCWFLQCTSLLFDGGSMSFLGSSTKETPSKWFLDDQILGWFGAEASYAAVGTWATNYITSAGVQNIATNWREH